MPYISQVTSNKKTILVVDDDETLTDMVQLMLSKQGYTTRVSHDAMKGLAAAVKYLPHAILLDLNMPDVDGFDFMTHKQKLIDIAHIPVIVLSANHTSSDVNRALKLGASGYITKPIDEGKLAQRLGKVVPSPLFALRETTMVPWAKVGRVNPLVNDY
jgi:two-component system, OmpR family, KDP operon response regulator KdpE